MPVDYQRFVASVTAAGLVTADDLRATEEQLVSQATPADVSLLARELVRTGKLTKFQAAAAYQDKVDSLVLGNYVVLDRLGAGGMGQVFRARHRKMDRIVALKVMTRKALDVSGGIERFQREVKAAARLVHPNIVTAYDADEAAGMHFLVMECVEGSDLSTRIKQHGPLPLAQAVDYVRQAACGLAHAHAKGLVHRDIKPSNLLVDAEGVVKILDMGLARFNDAGSVGGRIEGDQHNLTTTGNIMGTIDYIAPEQAMDSREADGRSDMYSLGCTLYYLVVGTGPFGGDTIMKRLAAHQHAPPPELPGASPQLAAVYRRMLAKRPAERLQQMQEVVAALDGCPEMQGGNRAAPQPGPVAPVPVTPIGLSVVTQVGGKTVAARSLAKPRSRMPLVAIGVGSILVVASVAALVMTRSSSPPEQPVVAIAGVNDPTAKPEAAASSPKSAPSVPSPAAVNNQPNGHGQSAPAQPSEAADAAAASTPPAISEPSLESVPTNKPPSNTSTVAASNGLADSMKAATAAEEANDAANVGRRPVPNAAQRAQADKLVDDIFGAEIAAAKSADAKTELIDKLLVQAEQTENDPIGQYAMLCRARDMAVEVPSPALCERALRAIAARFEFDAGDELTAALEKMTGKFESIASNRAVAEAALSAADDAAVADRWELAKRDGDAALAAARKTKDAELIKATFARTKEIAIAKQQCEAFETARIALQTNSQDATANLTVGRYLCFVQEKWNEGFPYLAKSADPVLAELAVRSVAASIEPADQVAQGDAWWAAAEKMKGKDRDNLRRAARYWYGMASDSLTGLAKARVEKRLAESEPLAAVSSMPGAAGSTAVKSAVSTAPANGLSVSKSLDCASQTYEFPVGPAFDSRKSWTLALEFSAAAREKGEQQLFLLGEIDSRSAPIILRLNQSSLEARITDLSTKAVQALSAKVNAQAGQWVSVVMRFDAAKHLLSVYVDGQQAAEQTTPAVAMAVKPVQCFVGARSDQSMRFYGKVRDIWFGNQNAFTPPTASPRNDLAEAKPQPASAAPAAQPPGKANGIDHPELLDCSSQPYEFLPGPAFDCAKSWTLAFEFSPPNVGPDRQVIFCYGDKSPSYDPIYVMIDKGYLRPYVNDSPNRKDLRLSATLDPSIIGRWSALVFRYDARSSEAAVYLNGQQAAREHVDFIPLAKPSPQIYVGSRGDQSYRFHGQLRNLWLGNEDEFVPPPSPPDGPKPPPPVGGNPQAVDGAPIRAPNGHFYKVFDGRMSWTEAKQLCEQRGGYLASLTTPDENAFVIDLIESKIGRGKLGTDDFKYWIGGYMTNGRWKWLTGEPIVFAPNKLPVNPDKPYLRHAGRNWLTMNAGTGLIHGFVCEWDKGGPKPPPPPPQPPPR
ncbi:MAG TPA: protein kinase [Pirellulales bacterium]|jgi:serine/threonine protein kinase|nr:protein kinase [Pirellulales bacterium]